MININKILKRIKQLYKYSIKSSTIDKLKQNPLIQQKINNINSIFNPDLLLRIINNEPKENELKYILKTSNFIRAYDNINNIDYTIGYYIFYLNKMPNIQYPKKYRYYLQHPYLLMLLCYKDNKDQISLYKEKTLFLTTNNFYDYQYNIDNKILQLFQLTKVD